ncbi:MAG: hypothetical protein IKI71_02800 [Lachnospiraceae bacterium]|nr:hypothetical protein [Lachnospiraceae bacterium]
MNELKEKIELQSMPTVSAKELGEVCIDYFSSEFAKGNKPKNISPIMLWGAPGVGKSESVYHIAKVLEQKIGKRVIVKDVRLSLFNPVDLRGIPSANATKTAAVWLRPEIFEFDESEDLVNILFLDELSTCSTAVQACAYQITLDRKIGEHKLPDNVLVIAAGNRKQDKSVSIQMPKALANRMLHFDVTSDLKSWKAWALENNIDCRVIEFLEYKPNYLELSSNSNDLAYPTPRSWAKVSEIIKTLGYTDNANILISATIGMGVASEFLQFCKCVDKLPNVNEIFEGTYDEVPVDIDVLYSLITGMTIKFQEYIDEGKKIKHAIKYAMKLPTEFSLMLHQNIVAYLTSKDSAADQLAMLEDDDLYEWTNKLEEKV